MVATILNAVVQREGFHWVKYVHWLVELCFPLLVPQEEPCSLELKSSLMRDADLLVNVPISSSYRKGYGVQVSYEPRETKRRNLSSRASHSKRYGIYKTTTNRRWHNCIDSQLPSSFPEILNSSTTFPTLPLTEQTSTAKPPLSANTSSPSTRSH